MNMECGKKKGWIHFLQCVCAKTKNDCGITGKIACKAILTSETNKIGPTNYTSSSGWPKVHHHGLFCNTHVTGMHTHTNFFCNYSGHWDARSCARRQLSSQVTHVYISLNHNFSLCLRMLLQELTNGPKSTPPGYRQWGIAVVIPRRRVPPFLQQPRAAGYARIECSLVQEGRFVRVQHAAGAGRDLSHQLACEANHVIIQRRHVDAPAGHVLRVHTSPHARIDIIQNL